MSENLNFFFNFPNFLNRSVVAPASMDKYFVLAAGDKPSTWLPPGGPRGKYESKKNFPKFPNRSVVAPASINEYSVLLFVHEQTLNHALRVI